MDKFDLILCGAGVAGFCAAIAAARRGASVALVERQTMPGGILTYYGNCSIDEFNNPFRQDRKMVIAGIGWEYALRLWRAGYARIPDMNAEYVKHFQYGVRVNPAAAAKIMDDMLLEAGVELFRQAYPNINVEIVNAGTGELTQRIAAEAENPQGDVLWGGGADTLAGFPDLFRTGAPALKSHNSMHRPASAWQARNRGCRSRT